MKSKINIESAVPNEGLSYFVKELFYLQIDSDKEQTMVAIDDRCYDFMFYKERHATLEYEHTKAAKINTNFLTVHQLNPPLNYKFGKSVSYFGIKAQPWMNGYFFPIHHDKGVLNLANIYRNQIADVEAILRSESFAEMVQLAEAFVAEIKPEYDDSRDLVKQVCEEIYRCEGMITVNELSDQFELNRQLLNKTFKTHVNYTLKKFIITVRMISLAKFRINNPDYSLTEVAHEFGYFDQAHFNYDFKRISGITPRMFFKELPPFFHRHKKI